MDGSKPASGNSGPSSQPPLWVPLGYFIVAQVSFVAALVWAPFGASDFLQFYYHPHTLALAHLIGLGWLTIVTMGASFQLVPVALETTLYSPRLAAWQFWLMLAGVGAMVGHFWTLQSLGIAIGAVLVLSAVVLYLINLGRTLWRLGQWDVVAQHIVAGLGYLGATALLGSLMAADRLLPFLGGETLWTIHAHANLAGIGWITAMIVGVSYKLVPMFSLGELPEAHQARRQRWQFWLLNLGVMGLFWALLFGSPVASAFAVLVAAGLGVFLWNMLEVLRTSRRPRLDWGLRHAVSAWAYLLVLAPLGVWLATGWMSNGRFGTRLAFAYGILGLLGWASLTVVGMTYKILPILVWYHRYSDIMGLRRVPSATEFLGDPLPRAGFWLLHTGILATVAGVLLESSLLTRAGTIVLGLAGVTFVLALCLIYRHLIPWLTPLPEARAART